MGGWVDVGGWVDGGGWWGMGKWMKGEAGRVAVVSVGVAYVAACGGMWQWVDDAAFGSRASQPAQLRTGDSTAHAAQASSPRVP